MRTAAFEDSGGAALCKFKHKSMAHRLHEYTHGLASMQYTCTHTFKGTSNQSIDGKKTFHYSVGLFCNVDSEDLIICCVEYPMYPFKQTNKKRHEELRSPSWIT